MHFWKIGKSLSAKAIFISVICLCVGLPRSLAREVKDSTGTQVPLIDKPQRIVSLAPSLGELAADLLGQDLHRIIGVSEYTDYPPMLKKVASIGPYHKFSLEKVVSLKPDLVLATMDGNSRDQVLQLRELKVPVIVVETSNFKEISESIRLVADAVGDSELGSRMATQLKNGIARIQEKSKKNPALRVLLQVGDFPLVVVGGKSFLDSALELIGATNIYGGGNSTYPRPSIEDVIQKNPDVIVVVALGDDPAQYLAMAKKWGQFPEMKAVKTRRIHVLQSDALLRPSLRILEGLTQLDRVLYGKK